MRAVRAHPALLPRITFDHMIAIGATEGNIIAAIMATHIAMKSGSAIPIVPGPMPIPLAWAIVTAQASRARAKSAAHAGPS
jgi:hypothetical protein